MLKSTLYILGCTLGACGSVEHNTRGEPVVDANTSDATTDASLPLPACDRTKPFGDPVELTSVNTDADEWAAGLSRDQLTIYLEVTRATVTQIYSASRSSPDAAFSTPVLATALNSGSSISGSPALGSDGLAVYWHSNRVDAEDFNLYVAKRASRTDAFGAADVIASVNSMRNDTDPELTVTGTSLYFASQRTGGYDIYRSSRQPDGTFAAPAAVGELSTSDDEYRPVLSPDELTIYFSRNNDIWRAKRTTADDGFGHIEPVAELNTTAMDMPEWVSDDDCTLYFVSNGRAGTGGADVYVAHRPK